VFFTQQCFDSIAGTVRIAITIRVPAGGLLMPPLLINLWVGWTLWEDPGGGSFFRRRRSLPFPDTSRDEDFARRLFNDLNHGLLGPPIDGKVIIINDFDEEEEAREEDVVDVAVKVA
jgi:hypothetical protein